MPSNLLCWITVVVIGCSYPQRVQVPLQGTKAGACAQACRALTLDDDVFECMRRCPGAAVSDGECKRPAPTTEVCADHWVFSAASTIGGLAAAAALGVGGFHLLLLTGDCDSNCG